VKYGRSEDLVAGEPGFDEYYRSYQEELKEIGKRPDVLVFQRSVFLAEFGQIADISTLPRERLDVWVAQAIWAIEVRSSAFLSRKYESVATLTRQATEKRVRESAMRLLAEYRDELSRSPEWVKFAGKLDSSGIDLQEASPRALGLRSTERLAEASQLTKEITAGLRALAQRDFLSVTPKAEDLTLVYRWIQRYGVPHHYCQVFFDRAVMLSFESILDILANPELEGRDYFIEADEKNQGKVTFKINIQLGKDVLKHLKLPEHSSALKELPKGRLLFYVRFSSSEAVMLPGAFGDD
jgi:type II restriction enzyme